MTRLAPSNEATRLSDPATQSGLLGKLRRGIRSYSGELSFAFANMASPVASLIVGVVSARFIQPEEMGAFNTATLLPTYLSFLHLGVFTGLTRNFPMEIGAGRKQIAHGYMKTSGACATYIAIVSLVVCVAFAAREYVLHGASLLFWAFAATAPTAVATPIAAHVDTALRGLLRFRALSVVLFGVNLVLIASSGLVARFGVRGNLMRLAIAGLVHLLLRLPLNVWSWRWRPDWAAAASLAKVGFPMLVSATIFSYIMVADRSVAVWRLSQAEVGAMTLATLLVNSLQFIPQSVSMALMPRMARNYGQNRSPQMLRKYIILTLALNVGMIVPLSAVLYFILPPLVRWLFPNYQPGVPAAQVACLTSMLWIYLGVGSIIGVVNKMRPYLVMAAISLVAIWVAGFFFVKMGLGIVGIAWARFLGTLLLCVFTIAYSFYLSTLKTFEPHAVRKA